MQSKPVDNPGVDSRSTTTSQPVVGKEGGSAVSAPALVPQPLQEHGQGSCRVSAVSYTLGYGSHQPMQLRVDSEPILPSAVAHRESAVITVSHTTQGPLDASISTAEAWDSKGLRRETASGNFLSIGQPQAKRDTSSQLSESQGVVSASATGSWLSGSSEDSGGLKVPGSSRTRRASASNNLKSSSKDKRRGSNRRASNSRQRPPGHKSKASRRDSTDYYDDSSGSDEWEDEAQIKSGPRAKFMPLYRIDGAIKKKGEHKAPSVLTPSTGESETLEDFYEEEAPPPVSILVSTVSLWVGFGTIWAWALLGTIVLLAHALRFYLEVWVEAQRLVADTSLTTVESGVACAMASAVSITRALRTGALGGLLHANSHASTSSLVAREMANDPAVELVSVAGFHETAVVIRPGDLHVGSIPPSERQPRLSELEFCCDIYGEPEFQDVLPCLGRPSSTAGFEALPPGSTIQSRWMGPETMTVGRFGQALSQDNWLRTRTFAAVIAAGGLRLATEVAMNLDVLVQPSRDAAPKEGGEVLICDDRGNLLAGSGVVHDLVSHGHGDWHPTLWDVASTLPWVNAIGAEDIAGTSRFEGWHGSDLVVMQPPQASRQEVSATDPGLRFIVYVKRDNVVSMTFRTLMVSTCVLAATAAPIILCIPLAALRWCWERRRSE